VIKNASKFRSGRMVAIFCRNTKAVFGGADNFAKIIDHLTWFGRMVYPALDISHFKEDFNPYDAVVEIALRCKPSCLHSSRMTFAFTTAEGGQKEQRYRFSSFLLQLYILNISCN
jgi:hypothetical protein